jgi:chitodextrinase
MKNRFNFGVLKPLLVSLFLFISILNYAQTFDCETYTSTNGCVIIAAAGSMPGYADMGNVGSWFEMANINLATAGTYQLTMTYANGKSPLRPCDLLVNGVAMSSIDFPATASFTTFGTQSFPTLKLNAGNNTIRLTATSSDGGPNFDNFILTKVADDTQKPSAPTALAVSALLQSSFTLSWAASTDNAGIMSYEVFANGLSKGITAELSLDIKGLTPFTLYQMTVVAKDYSENLSLGGIALPVTTTIADIISPLKPTGLSATNIGATSYLLTWSPSTDNVSVAGYEVFVNNISKGIAYGTSKIILGLTPSSSNSITIKAYDAVGNYSGLSNPYTTLTTALTPAWDESKNYLGIGLSSQADWESVFLYANGMVNSRDSYLGTGFLTTPDDWPANDKCDIIMGENVSNQHGRYRVIFKGNIGTITLSNGTEVAGSRIYDSKRNETSYFVDVTNSGAMNLVARVRNTGGVGMKNFKIYRPIYPGANEAQDTTEIFHRKTLEILSKFNFLRAMDFTSTNGNNQVDWTERNIIGQRTQYKVLNSKKIYGGAWEYLTLLANQTQKDLWICVPAKVNDDYIIKLAQLFKYGSDGVNPYTSIQAKPKYPPLDPSLKLMVEYSNEIWNFGSAFNQTAYADSVGKSLGLAGHNEYYVKRTVEISNIFRTVFGDSEMMTRVRPLLEWQKAGLDAYGNGSSTATSRLFHIEKNYPQPADYYVWGGGCSGYFNPCAGATIDNVWAGCGMDPITWAYESQEYTAYFTSAYGLRRVVYEGGPSFGDVNGGTGMEAVAPAAMLDERIGLEIVEHQNEWYKTGGNAFAYFCLSGDERWGFCQEPTITNKKFDAITMLYNQPRPAITNGYAVTSTTPTIIPGNQWRLYNKNGYTFRNTARTNGTYKITAVDLWHSYHFNVNKTTKYRVKLNYSSTGTGVFALYLGSRLLARPAITTGTNSTVWYSFDANPYMLQAVRIKVVSGTLPTITSVEVAEEISTGTSQNTKQSTLNVYPTCLTEGKMLHINNSSNALPVQVCIYSQTGALVYNVTKIVGDLEISNSKLPKGILICVAKSVLETNTVKIINL